MLFKATWIGASLPKVKVGFPGASISLNLTLFQAGTPASFTEVHLTLFKSFVFVCVSYLKRK